LVNIVAAPLLKQDLWDSIHFRYREI